MEITIKSLKLIGLYKKTKGFTVTDGKTYGPTRIMENLRLLKINNYVIPNQMRGMMLMPLENSAKKYTHPPSP